MKYSTNENCLPAKWNNKGKKNYQRTTHSSEINRWLDSLEETAADVFRKFRNDNKRDPSPAELRALIEKEMFASHKPSEQNNFYSFADQFIEECRTRMNPKTGKRVNAKLALRYQHTIEFLHEFEIRYRKPVDFAMIDLDFYGKFVSFLQEKNLSTNTIGHHIGNIKALMNAATERGINTNFAYKSSKFVKLQEESDSIYLTKKEIEALEKLQLKNGSDETRDLFLIGCYTGLRYSDYSTLKPGNIKEGFITKETQKQTDDVVIPIHPVVKKIFSKYKGMLPAAHENQATNRELKVICEKIKSMHHTEPISITLGGTRKTDYIPRYNLVSTHTARRSFATNLVLDGAPEELIMSITGHKTRKSFLKYVKVKPRQKAELLKKFWAKKKY